MAKDVKANPWVLDAATQGEGFGPNEDSVSVVFTVKPYVNQIKVDTGDGGDVLVHSRKNASAGDHARYVVVKLDDTPANDTLWVPIEARVDGIYATTLPTNASLFIYHGEA